MRKAPWRFNKDCSGPETWTISAFHVKVSLSAMLVSTENFHIFVLIFSSFSLSPPVCVVFRCDAQKKEGNEQFLPLKAWAEDGLICILQTFFCLLSRFSRFAFFSFWNAPLASPFATAKAIWCWWSAWMGASGKKKRLKLATQGLHKRSAGASKFPFEIKISSPELFGSGVINRHNFRDRSRQAQRQISAALIGLEVERGAAPARLIDKKKLFFLVN